MTTTLQTVHQETIPQTLKDLTNWVLWKYEQRDGNPSKVLYQPDGHRAKSNTPETWTTFDEVSTTLEASSDYSGLGFVVNPPFFGVDLDSCIRSDGTLTSWAQRVLDQCPSYCEVSPSGAGLKIIGIGDLPLPMYKSNGKLRCGKIYKKNLESAVTEKKPELAIWRQKFFTITGAVYGGRSAVAACPLIAQLFASLFDVKPPEPAQRSASPDERSERLKAAVAAMNKIVSRNGEHDGSSRLLAYARQAKRFIVDTDDVLRAIRAMECVEPFPVKYSDADVLKRYHDADVVAGTDFQPRSTEDPSAGMTVNGQPTTTAASRPTQPCALTFVPAPDLCRQFTALREPLINGLLRRGELLPRDRVRQSLSKTASILRIAGESLQKQYGDAAAEILYEAIGDAEAEIERFFAREPTDAE